MGQLFLCNKLFYGNALAMKEATSDLTNALTII